MLYCLPFRHAVGRRKLLVRNVGGVVTKCIHLGDIALEEYFKGSEVDETGGVGYD